MTYKEFKELADLMVRSTKKKDQAYKLGIDLYEAFEENERLIGQLWANLLTEPGLDWFNWFMYEKDYLHDGVGRPDLTASDEGTPICENLKGLYEYLITNNYFKIAPGNAETGN
jgi:hypothetical protein